MQRRVPEELLGALVGGAAQARDARDTLLRTDQATAVPFVAAAYGRRSLAIASHWPFGVGTPLPDHSTAVSLLDRLLHHTDVLATDGESYGMREARSRSGGRPSKR